jgi:hypothetical protein
MTEENKRLYLEKHIGEELRILLSSVNIWKLLKEKEAGFVVNIARDSVCVHFRTLIKFFTTNGGYDDSVINFGVEQPFNSEYTKLIGVIDEAILHIPLSRNSPRKPSNDSNDLNDQMENFQNEILRLWKEFADTSEIYGDLLRSILNDSRQHAHNDMVRAKEIMN